MSLIPAVQGCFIIRKSVNTAHHVNRTKGKKHMMISTDGGKAFDEIQADKATGGTALSAERPELPSKIRNEVKMPLCLPPIQRGAARWERVAGQEKERKGIHIGEEDVKLPLVTDDLISRVQSASKSAKTVCGNK